MNQDMENVSISTPILAWTKRPQLVPHSSMVGTQYEFYSFRPYPWLNTITSWSPLNLFLGERFNFSTQPVHLQRSVPTDASTVMNMPFYCFNLPSHSPSKCCHPPEKSPDCLNSLKYSLCASAPAFKVCLTSALTRISSTPSLVLTGNRSVILVGRVCV